MKSSIIDASALGALSWKEYAARFVFGGVITTLAAIVAKVWGPVVGGLFLAFPAILPASLTLVKKHDGVRAARRNAHGAIAGSVGLGGFAAALTESAAKLSPGFALGLAGAVWVGASVLMLLAVRWGERE